MSTEESPTSPGIGRSKEESAPGGGESRESSQSQDEGFESSPEVIQTQEQRRKLFSLSSHPSEQETKRPTLDPPQDISKPDIETPETKKPEVVGKEEGQEETPEKPQRTTKCVPNVSNVGYNLKCIHIYRVSLNTRYQINQN